MLSIMCNVSTIYDTFTDIFYVYNTHLVPSMPVLIHVFLVYLFLVKCFMLKYMKGSFYYQEKPCNWEFRNGYSCSYKYSEFISCMILGTTHDVPIE